VLADRGYPSKANWAWHRVRGIAATIPIAAIVLVATHFATVAGSLLSALE